MSSQSSNEASGSQPHPQPPTGYRKRPRTFVDDLPSIQVLVPPRGKFSPATSEWCFTYCTQSVVGRATNQYPNCRTFCIRKVFDHEVRRATSDGFFYNPLRAPPPTPTPATKLEIPLPPESHTRLDQFIASGHKATPHPVPSTSTSSRPSSSSSGKAQSAASVMSSTDDMRTSRTQSSDASSGPPRDTPPQYWQEGYYVWMSRSYKGAMDHMTVMRMDLHQQHMWMKNKEAFNKIWATAASRNRSALLRYTPDPESNVNAENWMAGNDMLVQGNKPPPFPELFTPHDSILLSVSHPPPSIHLPTLITNYLAPTPKLLNVLRESIESGHQRELAEKVWSKARAGEPLKLGKSICKQVWKIWQGEEGDGTEGA